MTIVVRRGLEPRISDPVIGVLTHSIHTDQNLGAPLSVLRVSFTGVKDLLDDERLSPPDRRKTGVVDSHQTIRHDQGTTLTDWTTRAHADDGAKRRVPVSADLIESVIRTYRTRYNSGDGGRVRDAA